MVKRLPNVYEWQEGDTHTHTQSEWERESEREDEKVS